jgi:hypothetical protein
MFNPDKIKNDREPDDTPLEKYEKVNSIKTSLYNDDFNKNINKDDTIINIEKITKKYDNNNDNTLNDNITLNENYDDMTDNMSEISETDSTFFTESREKLGMLHKDKESHDKYEYRRVVNGYKSKNYNVPKLKESDSLKKHIEVYDEVQRMIKNRDKYQVFKDILRISAKIIEYICINYLKIDLNGWSSHLTENNNLDMEFKFHFDSMVNPVAIKTKSGKIKYVTNPSIINQVELPTYVRLFLSLFRSATTYYALRKATELSITMDNIGNVNNDTPPVNNNNNNNNNN